MIKTTKSKLSMYHIHLLKEYISSSSSSSSSCRAVCTDYPDPLSSPVSIVHRSLEVFKVIS